MNNLPNFATYSTAVKFSEAAKILEKQDGDFMEVIVMQYAFAAELSLKCFFVNKPSATQVDYCMERLIEDSMISVYRSANVHDLKKIFNLLNLDVKNKMSAFFYEETGSKIEDVLELCDKHFV